MKMMKIKKMKVEEKPMMMAKAKKVVKKAKKMKGY